MAMADERMDGAVDDTDVHDQTYSSEALQALLLQSAKVVFSMILAHLLSSRTTAGHSLYPTRSRC